jgi:hypothetical protein
MLPVDPQPHALHVLLLRGLLLLPYLTPQGALGASRVLLDPPRLLPTLQVLLDGAAQLAGFQGRWRGTLARLLPAQQHVDQTAEGCGGPVW